MEWVVFGGGYLTVVALLFVAVLVVARGERPAGARRFLVTVAVGVLAGHLVGVFSGWVVWPDPSWFVATVDGLVPAASLVHPSPPLVGVFAEVLTPVLFAVAVALAAVAVADAAS